jgi:acyl transferase family protein
VSGRAGETGEPVLWWLAADHTGELLHRLDDLAADGDAFGRSVVDADGGSARLGIVDPSSRKLRLAHRLVGDGDPWHGRSDIWFSPATGVHSGGRIAFLFPGVEPGFAPEALALDDLARRVGLAGDAIPAMSTDTLAHHSAAVFRLALFLHRVLRRRGVEPDVIAGHSLGEWSGTVAAGIVAEDHADELVDGLDLDGVTLPAVEFLALSAGADAVTAALAADAIAAGDGGVVLSHDNSPHQSIVCGPPDAVDAARRRLGAAGILGYPLDIRSGFHTPFARPVVDSIRAHLDRLDLLPARVPLWSATTVAPYPDDAEGITTLHLRHLVEPVRFRPLVERLHDDAGVRTFLQVGIGSLTGFVDDTLRDRHHVAVPVVTTKRTAYEQLQRALTALWATGHPVRPVDPREPTTSRPPATASPPAPAAARPPTAQEHPPTSNRSAGMTTPVRATHSDVAPGPEDASSAPAAPPAPAAADPTTEGPAATTTGRSSAPADTAAGAPHLARVQMAADVLALAAHSSQDVLAALTARLAPITAGATTSAPSMATARAAPSAASATTGTFPPPAAPSQVGEPSATSTLDTVPRLTASPGGPPSDPATPIPPPPAETTPAATGWPTGKVVIRRRLSLATMPETLDHRLFEVPDGWHEPADGFPIVAMTTQLQLLQDVVEERVGRPVVEMANIRNMRWLDLSDPQDVDITLTPRGPDALGVGLGSFCRAELRVGAWPPAPRREPRTLARPRPAQVTPEEMFARRIMFHGPRFQGIAGLGPVGDDGMAARFDNLDTPGSLLDNLGKLIAYWVIEKRGRGESPLPIAVERIELFGPVPPPGEQLDCDVRILELQDSMVRADGVIVRPDGTLWCRVHGWTSHIFHLDTVTQPLYHDTRHGFVSEPQPGGWSLTVERWPTGAGRDLTARRILHRGEVAGYEALNLLERRRWLVEVAAVKDTVRRWLHDTFGIGSYPVELTAVPDGEGRYRVVGDVVPAGHDPRVTVVTVPWAAATVLADGHHRDLAAALVEEGDDDAEVAARVAAEVRSRNPGAGVRSTTDVDAVPSVIEIVTIPRLAVAWTE